MNPERINKPGSEEHRLSQAGDWVVVVAKEKEIPYDETNIEPIPIGHLDALSDGQLEATMYYGRQDDAYSLFANISLPDTELIKSIDFYDALKLHFQNNRAVKNVNGRSFSVPLDNIDGQWATVQLVRPARARGQAQHSSLAIFPTTESGQERGKPEPKQFVDGEGDSDLHELTIEMGKLLSVITNHAHKYYGGDDYYGRMEIALPKLVIANLETLNQYQNFPSFNDFGGLDREIAQLRTFAKDMRIPPEKFAEYGLERPHGVLLTGPGGVGKTDLVKALAKESNALFQQVHVSDIQSMWVGRSAENLRDMFNNAVEMATEQERPALIFLDECDGLFSKGAGGNSGAAQSLISELKVILSSLDQYPDVWAFMATNSLDNFDPALLRPGRIDLVLNIGLPNQAARQQIYQRYARRFAQHFEVAVELGLTDIDAIPIASADEILRKQNGPEADTIDAQKLAELSSDFTGADIKTIFQRLLRQKLHEDLAWADLTDAEKRARFAPSSIGHQVLVSAIAHHRRNRPAQA